MSQSADSGELVSVVIPCFNHGDVLADAIDSALGQLHSPIEVIVVDDGSTDETPRVASAYHDRVRFVSKPNGGPSSARNVGLSFATGQFVLFLDADDKLEPDFVTATIDALRRHPNAAFAYTQLRLFGREEGITEAPPYSVEALKENNFISVTALFRASVFDVARYDESLRGTWEDWDLYLTLAEHDLGGVLVDRPLVLYRRHDASLSRNDQADRSVLRGLKRMAMWRRHPTLYPWRERVRLGAAIARRGALAAWRSLRRADRVEGCDGDRG